MSKSHFPLPNLHVLIYTFTSRSDSPDVSSQTHKNVLTDFPQSKLECLTNRTWKVKFCKKWPLTQQIALKLKQLDCSLDGLTSLHS